MANITFAYPYHSIDHVLDAIGLTRIEENDEKLNLELSLWGSRLLLQRGQDYIDYVPFIEQTPDFDVMIMKQKTWLILKGGWTDWESFPCEIIGDTIHGYKLVKVYSELSEDEQLYR